MSEKIEITLFGKLTIRYHDETIDLSNMMGKQLVTLFEMLVYYRHHPLSRSTIMDTLWADNENPANVMKYSIFRLRNFLKTIPVLSEVNLICTGKNGYILNPEYTYIIDTERFDCASKLLKDNSSKTEAVDLVQELLDVYEGDIFLGEQKSWSVQASAYYRSIYQEYVRKQCMYYHQNDEYEAILPIAFKAAKLFPDHEDAHYYYLLSIMALGEYDKALHYYNTVTKMLVHDFEIPVSERMHKLYHTIMVNNDTSISIDVLEQQLRIAQSQQQAFYCEYDVFEYLCHTALRRSIRSKSKYYIALFSLHSIVDSDVVKTMNKLKRTIKTTLRSVDVYTRINKLQFCVLMECVNDEAAHIAVQRVLNGFYKKVGSKNVKIVYFVKNFEERG